jgi:hypothetical protein
MDVEIRLSRLDSIADDRPFEGGMAYTWDLALKASFRNVPRMRFALTILVLECSSYDRDLKPEVKDREEQIRIEIVSHESVSAASAQRLLSTTTLRYIFRRLIALYARTITFGWSTCWRAFRRPPRLPP